MRQIPFEDKQQLFKQGFSKGGSTGFGLFLVKKMIEVSGWTVNEEGKPREGARFKITIPKNDGENNFSFPKIHHSQNPIQNFF